MLIEDICIHPPNDLHAPRTKKDMAKWASKAESSGKIVFGVKGEEAELVNFIINCSKVGYGHTRKQILSLVQSIINDKGIEMTVSRERFKQHHPQLTLHC